MCFGFSELKVNIHRSQKKALVCFWNDVTFAARKQQSASFSVSS